MKHLKIYENKEIGLNYDEFKDILMKNPTFYPIFVLIEDWKELYTEEDHLIKTGTEVYSDDISKIELTTLCPKNIYTEIPEENLKFVEYRNKLDIDTQLKMYDTANKYNM